MKTLRFDVMRPVGGGRERFVATLRYEYSGMFGFDFNALRDWIYSKRPSLKGQPFNCYTDDEAVKVLYFNQDVDKIMRRYE